MTSLQITSPSDAVFLSRSPRFPGPPMLNSWQNSNLEIFAFRTRNRARFFLAAAESQDTCYRTGIGKGGPIEIFPRVPYDWPKCTVYFDEIWQFRPRSLGVPRTRTEANGTQKAHRKLGRAAWMTSLQITSPNDAVFLSRSPRCPGIVDAEFMAIFKPRDLCLPDTESS